MLSAIALGLCGGLFATGIMVGMADSMVNTAIDRYLGHLEIHTPTFKQNPLVNDSIPEAGEVVALLRSRSEVTGVSARTVIEGMVSSAVTNSGAQIIGVNPKDEALTTTTPKKIVRGVYLDDVGRLPVVVGKKLAEKLELRVHSKLVLSFAGRDGSIIYGSFRIVGIFETESTIFDKSTAFVRSSDLAALIGAPPLVHEIAVRLANSLVVPTVVSDMRARLPNLAVDSWKDLAPELKLTAEMTDISMIFFLGLILFGLLFGITNTMLMSVLERVREFGVLMAVGMKRRRVFWLIMLETVLLSLTGGLVGGVVGAILIDITSRTGIDLSVVGEGLSSYGISSMLYPAVPSVIYAELGVLVIVTALCAAVYPGMKATKLNPAASIRTYA